MLVAGVAGTALVPGEAGAQNQQRCFQLEKQLQRLGSSGLSRRAQASRARSELRRVNRDYRRAQGRADRLSCYSTFFFTETLRKTARCIRLDRQIRRLGGKRSRLRVQLDGASRPSNRRARRTQIIRALARNRCGAVYQREARRVRRNSGWNLAKDLVVDFLTMRRANYPRTTVSALDRRTAQCAYASVTGTTTR